MKDITPSDHLLPGTAFELSLTITDASGTGLSGEAANITLDIRRPDGTAETQLTGGDLTDEGDGEYTYDYTIPDVAGFYYARWHFGGTNPRDVEVQFKVTAPKVSYNTP